jgi:hypothetical protein
MKTRAFRLLFALSLGLLALAATGCAHRLPNVKASEIHQSISFPGFSSTADATGIAITDTTIRAADASWRVAVLGVAITTTAKDFQQRREKENDDR